MQQQTIQENKQGMSMPKKILFTVLGLMILSAIGFITATYITNLYSENVFYVDGEPTLYISDYILSGNISTVSGSQIYMSNLTYRAKETTNGKLVFNYWSVPEEGSTCPDYANDCNVTFFYGGLPLINDSLVTFNAGGNFIDIKTECKQFSCNQGLYVNVIFDYV